MSKLDDYNPNIYWEVAGQTYYRKAEALLASANLKNAKISFYYYDNEFANFQWHIEPCLSFNELAAERAQQLRDQNKYIRLWYSGGSDSHTVLHSFLDNNIPIDEIVMVRGNPIDSFDSASCAETNLRSLPYIQSLKHVLRKTKISLVDIGSEHYLDYYKDPDWFIKTTAYDFGDDPGIILGSRDSISRFPKLSMPTGCVEITGANKPKIIRRDGVYYVPFVDTFIEYPYWSNIRPFFTTHQFPELHAKQCHELKKIVHEHYPTGDLDGDIYNPINMSSEFKYDWYHCCRTILNYELDYGKAWKLISPKCQLRVNESLEHNPEMFKYYKGSLTEFQSSISHQWQNLEDAVDGIVGKVYCLGPYNAS